MPTSWKSPQTGIELGYIFQMLIIVVSWSNTMQISPWSTPTSNRVPVETWFFFDFFKFNRIIGHDWRDVIIRFRKTPKRVTQPGILLWLFQMIIQQNMIDTRYLPAITVSYTINSIQLLHCNVNFICSKNSSSKFQVKFVQWLNPNSLSMRVVYLTWHTYY